MTDLERAHALSVDQIWVSAVRETGIWMAPYAEQVAEFGRLVIPQMREALAAARTQALEEAAYICEHQANKWECASAIRALKGRSDD